MSRSRVLGVAALAVGLLALGTAAQAGRGIRVDIGDGAFDLRGEAWNESTAQEAYTSDPFIQITLPFGINFSGEAGRPLHTSAFQGPSWVTYGPGCPGSDPFSCGNFASLHPWLASNYITYKLTTKSGFVDREADANGQFSIDDALPAVQFRWFDIGPGSRLFDYQVILFDVSDLTGVDGDFDVELNFEYSNDAPLPPGYQNLDMGPESQHLETTDPAKRFTNFCFRSGALNFDCAIAPPPPPPPPPTTVPVSGTVSLVGLALATLVGTGLRRRRRIAS